MSTFFGFNVARSGLFASQRALNVTSHNIANANTPGYTRQRLEQQASKPMLLPNGTGMLGTGVDTIHIRNIRDEFLDFKYRSENKALGEWDTRADVLQNLQAIMNEPSTSGIRTVMDQFFASLQELNTKPENLTVRALVRERGIALAKTINQMGYQMEKMQNDLDFSVSTVVGEINGYAAQIADLNKQIYNYELDGNNANDLRDQRNLLLDNLSQLINVDAFEDNQGRMHVLVSGKSLVSHYRYSELATAPRTDKNNNSDLTGLSDVVWKDGSTFTIQSGKLKGLLDARDNADGSTKGVPYYMEQLNLFAKTFAAHVNSAHREGYGIDGSTGNDFFHMGENQFHDVSSYFAGKSEKEVQDLIRDIEKGGASGLTALGISTSPAYSNLSVVKMDGKYLITPKITATTLRISDKIDLDLNAIAASSTYAGLPGDGSNALNINLLKNNGKMFDWGKPEDFMKSLISNLGVDTQQAIRFANNQHVLIDQIENRRQSVSGVSLDEEMADMVKFQHAYNANARMITTIDEMIDILINRMGLVGR